MHDVVILGAGMAGMACARRLMLRGVRPLVVAPGHDVASRGETLSFRAEPVLDELGWMDLLDADTALPCAGRYSLWGSAALRRDDQQEQSGWHVDRARLEARMTATLDGVPRIRGEARRLSRAATHVTIDLADGTAIDTKQVIDCTGRAAVTAGSQAPLRRNDRLVATYCSFALDDDSDVLAATLVEAVRDGWWYMTVMPGGRSLLCFFTDSDLLPAGLRKATGLWAQMVSRTTATAARLDSLGLDPGNVELSFAAANTAAQVTMVEPRVIRAGDAATAQDPLGSNGLATALWSGLQAADSVMALRDDDDSVAARYEQRFLEGIESFLATQHAMYAAERRFSDAPFWQRRHASPVFTPPD